MKIEIDTDCSKLSIITDEGISIDWDEFSSENQIFIINSLQSFIQNLSNNCKQSCLDFDLIGLIL